MKKGRGFCYCYRVTYMGLFGGDVDDGMVVTFVDVHGSYG